MLRADVYWCMVADKGRTEKETWMVGFSLIMGILIEWYKDRDRAKYYKKCSKKNEILPIPAKNGLFSSETGAKTCR